jgi:hypothetical protein
MGFGQAGQVDPVGRAEEELELLPVDLFRLGQEGEDPAPVVVDDDDVELDGAGGQAGQGRAVVEEGCAAR